MSEVATTTDRSSRRTPRPDPAVLSAVTQCGPLLIAAEVSAERTYEEGTQFVVRAMRARREGGLDLQLGLAEMEMAHEGAGQVLAGHRKFVQAHASIARTLMFGPDCPCSDYPEKPTGSLQEHAPNGPAVAA